MRSLEGKSTLWETLNSCCLVLHISEQSNKSKLLRYVYKDLETFKVYMCF